MLLRYIHFANRVFWEYSVVVWIDKQQAGIEEMFTDAD
jgi:hypothetical protein